MGLEVKRPLDRRIEDFCSEVGVDGPVAVEGGKTRWNLNGLPPENTRLLKAPKGILSAKPEEMTVTVLTGTPVSELHKELQTLGQRTCLPDRGGTVGGALAVGENDLSVLGKGRVRDSVLQLRYVSADGQIISSGAPVVKNVSGFNLHKLMVGSFGTLGLFAEVTLRTNPIPPTSKWFTAATKHPQNIFNNIYKPSAVLWDGETAWVQLEGHQRDVEQQVVKLLTIGNYEEVEGAPGLPRCRWSISPVESSKITREETGNFVASIGVGIVWADQPQSTKEVDPTIRRITNSLKSEFDPTGRLNPGRYV